MGGTPVSPSTEALGVPPQPTVVTPVHPPGSPAPRLVLPSPPHTATPITERSMATPPPPVSFYFRDIKLLALFFIYLTALSYAFDFTALNHITFAQVKVHALFLSRILLLGVPASLVVAITTGVVTYETPLKEIFAKVAAIIWTNLTISFLTMLNEGLITKYLVGPALKPAQ